jgi:hypothetical protein
LATTPALSSPGIGSGLDVNAIVDKLMAVERQPLDQLNTKETTVQSQISAYGTLKSALAALQGAVHTLASPTPFRSMTATFADQDVASASVSDGAVAGSYSVEVAQLAQAHKLASNGFASLASSVGSGALTFTFGTYSGGVFTPNAQNGVKTVTITPAQSSLAGIRDAVNAANIGVTASIVNDGSANGQRLVFTSSTTGAANSLKITATDDDGNNTDAAGLSQLAYDPSAAVGTGKNLTEKVAAQDALLTVDGIDIQSSTNTVKDAIAGVTLTLAKANPGNPTTLSVAQSPGAADAARERVRQGVQRPADDHRQSHQVRRDGAESVGAHRRRRGAAGPDAAAQPDRRQHYRREQHAQHAVARRHQDGQRRSAHLRHRQVECGARVESVRRGEIVRGDRQRDRCAGQLHVGGHEDAGGHVRGQRHAARFARHARGLGRRGPHHHVGRERYADGARRRRQRQRHADRRQLRLRGSARRRGRRAHQRRSRAGNVRVERQRHRQWRRSHAHVGPLWRRLVGLAVGLGCRDAGRRRACGDQRRRRRGHDRRRGRGRLGPGAGRGRRHPRRKASGSA